MGWLWGGGKKDDNKTEDGSGDASSKASDTPAASSSSSSSTAAAAQKADVDPNDGRQVADAHKQAIESCKHLKDRYDQCFNNWYRHAFLRGDLALSCDEYFEEYRACLVEDMEGRGLGHLCMFGPDKPENFDDGKD
ncbi:hypothetical protein FOL47_005436 [Perkinsus chesapeaki]|uniref:Uncharacterized protein n=1 Tax=Perkinsus chesapeaki TaxID=330153 RepID=A0A7J6MYL5_PERCH|nr:hypothetical protein FOL47_005436 [Perkinsus chesapeaki]